MPEISQYKVGVVLGVKECGKNKSGKLLKACTVNVGDDGDNPLIVVTSAPNVRESSRVAVAPLGSFVLGDQGEDIEIRKTVVAGVVSEGMLCDSRMLGWSGGAEGVAVQIPPSFEIGSAPPSTKPRPNETRTELPQSEVKGLFQKKPTKEEKKKLAEERKKARAQKKVAKKNLEES